MDENSEYLPGISDYSAAICEELQEAVPEVPWTEEIKGPALSAGLSGTIFADEIKFEALNKIRDVGTITFGVTIVAPDLGKLETPLEELAMKVRKALNGMDVLEGQVTKIRFGVSPSQRGRNPGTAILFFDVKVNV